jgi:hypothetical protein
LVAGTDVRGVALWRRAAAGGRERSRHAGLRRRPLSAHIDPFAAAASKGAALVQDAWAARRAVVRAELNLAGGVERSATSRLDDLKVQPALVVVDVDSHRAGGRMPGSDQVCDVGLGEGAEAGAHEGLRGGRAGSAGMERFATGVVGVA